MNTTSLVIKDWAAWMPGIDSCEQWQQWAQGLRTPQLEASSPSPADVPPMLRRRLSRLGKTALAMMSSLENKADLPYIFCSRHGDIERTTALLESLADNEPLSPTQFSLSVHNAIGGISSIAHKNKANITALACGDDSLSIGLIETIQILHEQHHEQGICVIYDEPVPDLYQTQHIFPQYPYAVALLLSKQPLIDDKDTVILNASMCSATQDKATDQLKEPQALAMLRFLLSPQDRTLILPGTQHTWRWEKG